MKDRERLIGQKFTRWTVTSFSRIDVDYRGNKRHVWNVVCDCGNVGEKTTSQLRQNRSLSCGCYTKDTHCEKTRRVLEGQRIGILEVLSFEGSGIWGTKFKVRCDCGVEKIVLGRNLAENRTVSCGCRGIDYFDPKSAINSIFADYKNRATKKKLEFSISRSKFEILIKEPCQYCGIKESNLKTLSSRKQFKYNGLDRLDSSLGYFEENIVPCCVDCNIAKSEMTLEQWKNFIKRVYNFMFSV